MTNPSFPISPSNGVQVSTKQRPFDATFPCQSARVAIDGKESSKLLRSKIRGMLRTDFDSVTTLRNAPPFLDGSLSLQQASRAERAPLPRLNVGEVRFGNLTSRLTPYSKSNDPTPVTLVTPSLPREAPAVRANGSTLPSAAAALPSASTVVLAKHPAAQHAFTRLRNRHSSATEIRSASLQLLLQLVVEATRTLPTQTVEVETAAGDLQGQTLARPVVLLAVDRAGLGLAHRMVEYFPDLIVGSIGHDGSNGGQRAGARLHLPNAPALGDARVIVLDPVIATGTTALRAVSLARRAGANDIVLAAFVASATGLELVHATVPHLPVVVAAIDTKSDSRRGPLPGIGNFAARLFG
jgi:uracil phosphoribosyltransferase